MNKYILTLLLSLPWTFLASSQILRNDGKINVSAGYLVISGGYQNESAAILTLDGSISVTGDWINNSSTEVIPTIGTNGNIIFKGTLPQAIGGTAALTNFNNMIINNGADVHVNAAKFTSNYSTTLNGSLHLKSDATGTASFLSLAGVTGTGTANFERYMTGNKWHVLSSAVDGQDIESFVLNPANNIPTKDSPTKYGIEYYDEAAGVWTYYTSDPGLEFYGNFIPGTGYIIRNTASGVVTFNGNLNAGEVNVSITRALNGWNAVGNPYPSSLGFNHNAGLSNDNFLDWNAGSLDPSFAAGYFWNESSVPASYTIINNVDPPLYIQPGQGFVVKSNTGGGTLTFDPGMQLHGNPTFFKKSSLSSSWDQIMLYANSSALSAMTKIFFRDDMSRGLDITYDAGLFGGNSKFLLYTNLVEDNGVKFALQCLPSTETDMMVVPIGFDCAGGGLVSFHADINSLPAGYTAILEDRLFGTFTDLAVIGASYDINLEPSTSGTGRFFLHAVPEGPNSFHFLSKNEITIFAQNKEIFIRGWVENHTSATLFDLTGKKLAIFELQASMNNRIELNDGVKEGIYILKIVGPGTNKSGKVFIK